METSRLRQSPRDHSVTPRYIHKLFETEGETFSEFVLARRLESIGLC